MLTFGELTQRNGLNRGKHDAFVESDRRINWATFDQRTDALAHAFKNLGISQNSRVAMLAPDCIEVAELLIACAKSGIVRVGLNIRLSAPENAHLIDDSQPDCLIVPVAAMCKAKEALAISKHQPKLIGLGEQHDCELDYETLIQQEFTSGPFTQTPSEILMLCYTTGSTGLPKGAIYEHQKLLNSILYTSLCEGATHDDVWLHAMPAGDVPVMHLFRNIFHGSTSVIVGEWQAEKALQLIEREKTTRTVLVPTMVASLLESPELKNTDLSSMQLLGYGASPMPPAMIRQAMDAFGCPLLQMFGTTELTGMATMLLPCDHQLSLNGQPDILNSAGKPLPWVDIRIVDEEGLEVPTGEMGELVIRSEFTISGYWNQPEKYAETVKDGWLYTGDFARQDENGYVYLGDRVEFRMKSGGYNVYPTEVEAVVAEHPDVSEVCVVGIPDAHWGDRIHAVVTLKPGHETCSEAIKDFCEGQIARFKIPKTLDIWQELPKGATGKILKRAVLDHYNNEQNSRERTHS
ncbi:MAG: class I adenylate-forming enzyme family protein [Endozoicomonas sp.]|uniref:class I adenylate-forming enzyme family protein n=1 Tax=Endozoicomonas sp. TaxID=1892382 RepID=UPI003D9BC6F6